eukprot:GHVO01058573.1.p1 GENE.GHVO01058573.1~~GHVO01058573.1.p1  ORF type:complete len:117 (+),score=13.60 GHVO01058573.1:37-387(+)
MECWKLYINQYIYFFFTAEIMAESRYEQILIENHISLSHNLNLPPLTPFLIKKSVISEDDCERIMKEKTNLDRNTVFLNILSRKGELAFMDFVGALKDEQPFLHVLLEAGVKGKHC